MTWHLEILGQRQKRVLTEIGPILSERGFFLVGGTALALYLGHRRSVDFDWFTRDGFDPLALAQDLRELGIPLVTEAETTGTLHGIVRGVHVSLIRHNYPFLAPLRAWRRIRIAAPRDLAAMKLSAIAQRGAKKDFVDIYALGKRAGSLRQMLRWYQKKLSVENMTHVLLSLLYFDDADRERLPKMLWEVDWRTVKTTIQRWVQELSEPEA